MADKRSSDMLFSSWSTKWQRTAPSGRRPASRRRRLTSSPAVAALESLEEHVVLSAFTAGTAAALVADISAANKTGGANTITLTAPTGSPYVLTAVNNTTDGPTVLPVIASGDSLTIQCANGGHAIDASKLGRQFDVASGASLTLGGGITLQNGLASSQGGAARGGAILNQGSLVLNGVVVQSNSAVVSDANEIAAGGGIWSDGSLTVASSTFERNFAVSRGLLSSPSANAYGGAIDVAGGTADITASDFGQNMAQSAHAKAYGGALYVGGGTVTMANDLVGQVVFAAEGNRVYGAYGAFGGGLYVASGNVDLDNDTFDYNAAFATNVAYPQTGGGIYIASGANVSLDVNTIFHTQNNSPGDIYGQYSRGVS
jgi:hypothetical protein